MRGLDGRSLLIVGGGSGIGLAAVQLAADAGAKVVLADVAPEAERHAGGNVSFAQCDARDPASVEAAVAAAVDRNGGLDGVLTTVGGAQLGELGDMTLDAWDAEIAFNLTSVYVVCRAALPVLREQRRGAIVTTSSGYALLPGADRPGYVAAKAGVIALTRAVAATLAPHGARANCIAPGPTDTERFREMNGGDEGVERVRQSMPMGTIPTAAECARVALFLLSDDASQITGQVVHVNGGLVMA